MFHSVLVPLDLSASAARVAERACRLPFGKRARVTLLHVIPKSVPKDHRARVTEDAHTALGALADRLAEVKPEHVELHFVVKAGDAADEIAKAARAVRADLVVVGRGRTRAIHDAFLGSTAERVTRRADRPVLVVRGTAHKPYRTVLLALDLEQSADHLLALALAVSRRAPPPALHVAHASDAPFEGLVYPSLSKLETRAYHERERAKAQLKLHAQMKAALAHLGADLAALRYEAHVDVGSPRTMLPHLVGELGAELIVLGTHGREGLAHMFLGTVAGDVLRAVTCDALMVPPGHARAA